MSSGLRQTYKARESKLVKRMSTAQRSLRTRMKFKIFDGVSVGHFPSKSKSPRDHYLLTNILEY